MRAFHRAELRIFIGDAGNALFKFLRVLRRPPIAQISLSIELTALIVEAMRELMTNHRANASKVRSVVGAVVIKRRLQNTGGKCDDILGAIVGRVHSRGGHLHFTVVYRFANLSKVVRLLEAIQTLVVSECASAGDCHCAVIPPMIWVADLVGNLAEFGQSLFPGWGRHPVQCLDVVRQRSFQFLHHFERPLLALRAERELDEFLAQRIAHLFIHQRYAALPTRRLLTKTLENATVEPELLADEWR